MIFGLIVRWGNKIERKYMKRIIIVLMTLAILVTIGCEKQRTISGSSVTLPPLDLESIFPPLAPSDLTAECGYVASLSKYRLRVYWKDNSAGAYQETGIDVEKYSGGWVKVATKPADSLLYVVFQFGNAVGTQWRIRVYNLRGEVYSNVVTMVQE